MRINSIPRPPQRLPSINPPRASPFNYQHTAAATLIGPPDIYTLKSNPQPSNNITPTTLKSSPFTNGTHKRHLTTTTPSPMVVSYKECLKNHAASLGGHALDGCGEFMPSSTVNPNDPRSLKCAACACHRNFHRREPQEQHILTHGNLQQPTCSYRYKTIIPKSPSFGFFRKSFELEFTELHAKESQRGNS